MPKFVPTEEQRRTAKSLAAYGIKQEGIAHVLSLSVKTLRKHFRKELTLGEIEAVANVAQTYYQMAKSGKHPQSTIHFLDKRQRWQDVQSSETRPAVTPDFIVEIEKEAA
jgi:uncharacterized membrane protein YebE (DUF533 family)